MKGLSKMIFAALAMVSLYACAIKEHELESVDGFDKDLVFTASREGVSPDTKTVRMDDGATWWNASEEISVFYGSGSAGGSKFTSLNNTLQEIVEFSGSVTITGSGKEYWAVYPYSEDNASDGTSITTVIPDNQIGYEGNFSGDAFPAIAKSKTIDLAFWNICGGIKFFVSRSDIKSVTFKGNNDEVLAGKVKVAFYNGGKPVATEVLDGKTEVTLTAPDGGAFKADKYYYLTLLPCDLSSGFTMTFNTADSKGSVTSNGAQTVKRSIFGVLKNVDSKATEWESIVEPEWVDLGLSVKWATFNVGATKPEEYGDYFAWGETEPKDDYNGLNNKWCDSNNNLTKYNNDSTQGVVDNKAILDLEDDAAYVNWGGIWRMPTLSEQKELLDNCTWMWTSNYKGTGAAGHIVTSQMIGFTDKSIFLPAAGFRSGIYLNGEGSTGFFWSSSLNTNNPRCAHYLYIDSGDVGWSGNFRYIGLPVRPVYGDLIHPESVSLNQTTLSLYIGDSEQLTAYITPSDASEKSVTWSSDNTDVATVDENGKVTAVSAGSTIITVTTTDGGLTSTCAVTVESRPELEAVDLGLSVKWATFNVGAAKPEEYGDYFAWGETEPKSDYSWATYKWSTGERTSLTKYVTDASYGVVDDNDVLALEDDAAFINWGGNWRFPTLEEFEELRDPDNCSWIWEKENGVNGYRITSKITGYTEKSIFLPAAGYYDGISPEDVGRKGYYHSSSLLASYYPDDVKSLFFVPDGVYYTGKYRAHGLPVRPVEGSGVYSIRFDRSSINVYTGRTIPLIVIITPNTAKNKDLKWGSSDSSVAIVDQDGNVTALSPGVATITAKSQDGNKSATCTVTVMSAPSASKAVDLGLTVDWAPYNLGASTSSEYGDLYAWGETEPKAEYSWSTYKWCDGTENTLTKYNSDTAYGVVDNKTILDIEDDAAHVNWGETWRMPTKSELDELLWENNCSWEWTGRGYLVTSKKTNNSIFLPADHYVNDSGSGYRARYWTSSLFTDYHAYSYILEFTNSQILNIPNGYPLCYGLAIRPVNGVIRVTSVSVSDYRVNVGSKARVSARVYPETAADKSVTWSSSNPEVASITPDGLLSANTIGTSVLTVKTNDRGHTASCTVRVTMPVPEAVDLGLSVQWASFNLGATEPEERGDYFAWGEKDPYYEPGYSQSTDPVWKAGKESGYWWTSYSMCDGTADSINRYKNGEQRLNFKQQSQYDSVDDTARYSLGGSWRMPTPEEFNELRLACDWEWTNLNGTNGYNVKSRKTGNSIFLPASGRRVKTGWEYKGAWGCYWMSTTYTDPSKAHYFYFDSKDIRDYQSESRYCGLVIRPVYQSGEM